MPQLRIAPDWYLALNLAATKNVKYVGLPFVEHRYHANNVTTSNLHDARAEVHKIFSDFQKKKKFEDIHHYHEAIDFNPYLNL